MPVRQEIQKRLEAIQRDITENHSTDAIRRAEEELTNFFKTLTKRSYGKSSPQYNREEIEVLRKVLSQVKEAFPKECANSKSEVLSFQFGDRIYGFSEDTQPILRLLGPEIGIGNLIIDRLNDQYRARSDDIDSRWQYDAPTEESAELGTYWKKEIEREQREQLHIFFSFYQVVPKLKNLPRVPIGRLNEIVIDLNHAISALESLREGNLSTQNFSHLEAQLSQLKNIIAYQNTQITSLKTQVNPERIEESSVSTQQEIDKLEKINALQNTASDLLEEALSIIKQTNSELKELNWNNLISSTRLNENIRQCQEYVLLTRQDAMDMVSRACKAAILKTVLAGNTIHFNLDKFDSPDEKFTTAWNSQVPFEVAAILKLDARRAGDKRTSSHTLKELRFIRRLSLIRPDLADKLKFYKDGIQCEAPWVKDSVKWAHYVRGEKQSLETTLKSLPSFPPKST